MTENGYKIEKPRSSRRKRNTGPSNAREMCDQLKLDLLLTSGGTGFSPRD